MSGLWSPTHREKFEAFGRMGGVKLLESPVLANWPKVVQEADPLLRWYRALQEISGAYKMVTYATQQHTDGHQGIIWLGEVEEVCAASATLCVKAEAFGTAIRPNLEALCSLPRYSGPCQHWRSVRSLLSAEEPDYSRAVHEAVSALEALCRILVGDDSMTLGDALKRLRESHRLHPALAKSLEGLWGYASEEPGVRHGAAKPNAPSQHEALYVIGACEAGLVMLLTLD